MRLAVRVVGAGAVSRSGLGRAAILGRRLAPKVGGNFLARIRHPLPQLLGRLSGLVRDGPGTLAGDGRELGCLGGTSRSTGPDLTATVSIIPCSLAKHVAERLASVITGRRRGWILAVVDFGPGLTGHAGFGSSVNSSRRRWIPKAVATENLAQTR